MPAQEMVVKPAEKVEELGDAHDNDGSPNSGDRFVKDNNLSPKAVVTKGGPTVDIHRLSAASPASCQSPRIFGGRSHSIRLNTFHPDDQMALAPLDIGNDGTININDLKAAAKMYGAAQVQGVIPIDAFPTCVHHTLNTFDMDGDGHIDSMEFAHAAELYKDSKNKAEKMFKLTMCVGVAMVILLIAMLGVTMAAVDLMKETETRDDGVMRVAGTDTPIRLLEQHVNVPLGAIPLLAVTDPITFLDQMNTLTIKLPEGGYRRTTVTDAEIQFNYGNGTVGAIIYTSEGHSMRIFPDAQNITTEAHVTLTGGRTFDVCAPCGECGALSMLLTNAQQEILTNYLTHATEKVNRGDSRACRLQPGRIANGRGFQALSADDGLCNGVAADGVSDTYHGSGHIYDDQQNYISVKFAVNGDHKQMVVEQSDTSNSDISVPLHRVIFDGPSTYGYTNGNLEKCSSAQAGTSPWTTSTNLRLGVVGGFEGTLDFTVDAVHDGLLTTLIPSDWVPSLDDCAAVAAASSAAAAASTARHAHALTNVHPKLHREAARMRDYHELLMNLHADERRAHELGTTESETAVASYDCTGDPNIAGCVCHNNACMKLNGNRICFTGSDDLQDWLANGAGVFYKQTVGGQRVHGGFADEFYKLQPEVSNYINGGCGGTCNGVGDVIFCGHSLGGAMATMARLHYGNGQVVTYGCPQLYDNKQGGNGCNAPGASQTKRVFHQSDPVAGNLFGALSSYWHSAHNSKKWYESCSTTFYWRGWWPAYRTTCSWQIGGASCTDNTGSFSVNFGAHSMANEYNHMNQ